MISNNDNSFNNLDTNRISNRCTLEYLSNTQYKKIFKKNKLFNYELNKDEFLFYKKRVIALTKDMLKGKYYSKNLEKIHNEYVLSLIDHFKKIDEIELIQNEYKELNNLNLNSKIETDNININNEIIIKKSKPISIENFVTKKEINKTEEVEIPIPQKKMLNISTPEFRIKGIEKKNKENK